MYIPELILGPTRLSMPVNAIQPNCSSLKGKIQQNAGGHNNKFYHYVKFKNIKNDHACASESGDCASKVMHIKGPDVMN